MFLILGIYIYYVCIAENIRMYRVWNFNIYLKKKKTLKNFIVYVIHSLMENLYGTCSNILKLFRHKEEEKKGGKRIIRKESHASCLSKNMVQ